MAKRNTLPWNGDSRYPLWALAFLAFFYASISFVNHSCFRTFGLDLGLYTNALYDYAHFQFNDSSSFRSVPENLLGDHFDMLLPLFSPFSRIFGSWTLLLIQWAVLLFGACGIYRFSILRTGRILDATLLMLVFGLHFGISGALSFDYHSNVVAAALLPWFFVGLQERRPLLQWLTFTLILFARENMSLWMVFVATGACWYYRDPATRKALLLKSLIAGGWFMLVSAWWMPQLHEGGVLSQFRYSVLGKDIASALTTIVTDPALVIRTLFTDHLPVPGFKPGIKQEFWFIFLLSGTWVLLRVPGFIWMAVPILLQKLLNDQVQVWGVNDHYNAEFAPLLAIGGAIAAGTVQQVRLRTVLLVGLLVLDIAATIRTMDRVQAFVRRENLRVYQAPHWKSVVDKKALSEALGRIPADASVSAHTNLHPRVAWRDSALIFPKTEGCRYVLLLEQGNPFPFTQEDYRLQLDSLRHSDAYSLVFDQDGVILLRRK